MKRTIIVLLLMIVLNGCSLQAAETVTPTSEPTPPSTIQTIPGTTITPILAGTTTPINPTDIFITQVMATKYAARTEYAAFPTVTPTPSIPSSSPGCQPADLQTSTGAQGATGRIAMWVHVTNISGRPCFVPAWPTIQLLDQSSKPLDIIYEYIYPNANPSSLPPTQESKPGEPILFGLNVDQSSQVFMLWGDWCLPAISGGVTIRMSLLGRIGWVDIHSDIDEGGYCDDPSSPSTLDIAGFGY